MSASFLSPRVSAIWVTASMAIFARCSLAEPTALLPIVVRATLRRVSRSLTSTGTATAATVSMAFWAALR